MLTQKYQPVLDLSRQVNMKNTTVSEEGGVLKVGGTTHTQYEKNILWDKIKEVGGENPTDIQADFNVETTDYFHIHTVEKGESLSKIAKKYFGEYNKYMDIFNTNKDQLSNPDVIQIGQKLKIPNK